MVEISSSSLSVKIEEHGAQLRSLFDRSRNEERLWPGDSSIWTSSAPVVFPVIGKLNDMSLRVDGTAYKMKSNGLIRYMDPSDIQMGQAWAEFTFTSSTETLTAFPFHWRFSIRYEIKGPSLMVTSQIENTGHRPLWYNYAGHPGFKVPIRENEKCNDYYIEFERPETISVYDVCSTGQLTGSLTPYLVDDQRVFIRKELFSTEALAFHAPISRYVTLKSITRGEELRVWIEGFDNMAVWSPYVKDKSLSFICIETWIGHSDFKGFSGEFSDRDGVAELAAGAKRNHTYRIDVL